MRSLTITLHLTDTEHTALHRFLERLNTEHTGSDRQPYSVEQAVEQLFYLGFWNECRLQHLLDPPVVTPAPDPVDYSKYPSWLLDQEAGA